MILKTTHSASAGISFSKRLFLLPLLLLISGLGLTNANISFFLIRSINEILKVDLDVFFRAEGFYCFGVMLVCLALMMSCYSSVFNLQNTQRSGLAVFILLSSFIFILIKTKQSTPVFDEYTATFDFFCKYSEANSIKEKFRIFMEPYFECRTPIPFVISLLYAKLKSGYFPFSLAISINAILLLWSSILLFRSVSNQSKLTLYLPFLLLFIFNSQFLISSINSFSGLSYHGVILLSILAIRALSYNSIRGRICALIFALMAIFTFGNGLVIIPLLFLQELRQRGLKNAVLLISPLLLAGVYYFYDYHPFELEKNPFDVLKFLMYIPVFLGSSFQFFYKEQLPFVIGLCILTLYIYATVKSYFVKNPILYYSMGFIILSAVMTAAFRHTISFDTALRLRYGLFSSFATFVAVLMAFELFPGLTAKPFIKKIAGIAVVFNLATTLFFYPESSLLIINNKQMLQEWKVSGNIKKHTPYFPGDLDHVIKCSTKKGWWKIAD